MTLDELDKIKAELTNTVQRINWNNGIIADFQRLRQNKNGNYKARLFESSITMFGYTKERQQLLSDTILVHLHEICREIELRKEAENAALRLKRNSLQSILKHFENALSQGG